MVNKGLKMLLFQTVFLIWTYFGITSGWLFSSSKEQCCHQYSSKHCFNNNAPFNNMPLPECFTPTYKLFTSTTGTSYANGLAASHTSIPSAFSPSKMTVFITHGYRDHPELKNQWMIKSMQNLLQKGNFNIFIMDWSADADKSIFNYDQAAANAREAGYGLYQLVLKLYSLGLTKANTYCVGHSLGGHICGFAGQYLGSNHFGRITGVDPAGPEFEDLSASGRLSKDDADFVDVMHTNGGGNYVFDYGSLLPMGHVDFYPNGGKKQPGCSNKRRKRSTSDEDILESDFKVDQKRNNDDVQEQTIDQLIQKLKDILQKRENSKKVESQSKSNDKGDKGFTNEKREWEKELEAASKVQLQRTLHRIMKGNGLTSFLSCSHGRATDMYYESITSNCQKASDTKICSSTSIPGSCTTCTGSCPIMGYHAAANTNLQGKYYMKTSGSAPFCTYS